MERPNPKPSLSQQLLRTFRPRSSATAAPFISSATASPAIAAVDANNTPDVGFDVYFPKGIPSQDSRKGTPGQVTPLGQVTDVVGLPVAASKATSELNSSDYTALMLMQELRKPLPPPTSHDREPAIQRSVQCLRTLIVSIKRAYDSEENADEQEIDPDPSTAQTNGPPQAEVFKLCLLLLSQAREGQLPLTIRLGACELLTNSVHLSDLRAAKVSKAARETRSGAPGSQSSRAKDADQPLANIDRAALYTLVRTLSDRSEGATPTQENHYETRLPALPMQIRALDVLSCNGRDVVSFPGILEFLSDALETIWQELQILRALSKRSSDPDSAQNSGTGTPRDGQATLMEQLSLREWSVLSCLQLITSIVKFSFAKVDVQNIEVVLQSLAHMMRYTPPAPGTSPKDTLSSARKRSKSREKKPLTEGYDYYGLDSIASESPSPADTPKAAQTPKIGPRIVGESPSVAPIALATVPPASLSTPLQEKSALILHNSEVQAVCKLVDSVLLFGFIPSDSVEDVARLLCCILGLDLVTQKKNDWTSLVKPVLANLLRSHCANSAIRYVRSLLVEGIDAEEDAIILAGAVEFLKRALFSFHEDLELSVTSQDHRRRTEDALKPSFTVSQLLPALNGALRRQSDTLDIQVMNLVADLVPLDNAKARLGIGLNFEDWESLLDLPTVAKRHLHDLRVRYNSVGSTETRNLPAALAAMVRLVGSLRLDSPRALSEEVRDRQQSLPWSPKLAALLLSLAQFLPEEKRVMLIDYYKASHMCLPCSPNWISNIRALLSALFHQSENGRVSSTLVSKKARLAVVQLVFDHVFVTVQDFPAYRSRLLLEVILPLSQSALLAEQDHNVDSTIRKVLIEAAVTSATYVEPKQEENGAEDEESKDDRVFKEIIDLHCRLARSSAQGSIMAKSTTQAHVSFADPPGSHEHKPAHISHSRHSSSASNTVPTSTTAAAQDEGSKTDSDGIERQSRAVQSALDLITIFQRLAFSSPWVLLPTSKRRDDERVQRAAWEKEARSACLLIFRALLSLVEPASNIEEEHTAVSPPSIRVRLAILQWLVRMRTDGQHRIYIAGDMYDMIAPAAISLKRGPPSPVQEPSATSMEPQNSSTGASDRLRPRRDTVSAGVRDSARDASRSRSAAERSVSRVREVSRERGRKENIQESGSVLERNRSQSQNRAPQIATRKAASSEPLWRVPETLLFEVPPTGWRSDVVFTYIHAKGEQGNECQHHHHTHSDDHGLGLPTPLPISQYLAVCIAILTSEQEWDLVSFILCHLPHQLANKHLVCGPKAQRQVMALRQMLVSSILEQGFVNQVILPDDVKKSDVYAVSYMTLTTLISYRTLFSRSQQDELVEAFMAGLNKSSNTAQPCIRALSVACYELQKSINRHLPKMLVKLSTVMSSSAMSVHILELIAAIGHLPSLYANFTETDYRRIFGIALQYIQYHHQRHSEEDTRSSATNFTLSQYVIMLAYYNISLWFLIIKINERPKYVESIRKGLLLANEGRTKVADQTEVCFDFLGRFTFSNAEPRPQKSFLNCIVKSKGASTSGPAKRDSSSLSKHYIQGGALVTVTALEKVGWAEILVRRPSGVMVLICKLENAPKTHLPEGDGDKIDLPAALMMDRTSMHEQRTSLAEWVRKKIHDGEIVRSNRPHGPYRSGLGNRPRASSFSAGDAGPESMVTFVQKDADVYTNADADKHGRVLEPESEELRQTMQRVLSDQDRPELSGSGKRGDAENIKHHATVPRADLLFDPGFIALQLSAFPDQANGGKPPVVLPNEKWVERMVRAVDLTPVVDFHKIGVLYVGNGQKSEKEILGNLTGSQRYAEFLTGLGYLVKLYGQQDVYTGGLDIQNDDHGKYAYVWSDEISQIVYHTTTLMPNDEVHDPHHARKKALIGNDWVRIVWNESGREYDFDTIKTQFNFINIIISPNSRGGGELGSIGAADALFYRVSLQRIDGLPDFSPVGDGQLVSATALPNFVRILALNCSLVSQIYVATGDRQAGQSFSYTSNWVSRLHHLERARSKIDSDKEEGDDESQRENSKATHQDIVPISAGDATAYDILTF